MGILKSLIKKSIKIILSDTPYAEEFRRTYKRDIKDVDIENEILVFMNNLLYGLTPNNDLPLLQMLYHRYTLFEPLLSGFAEDFALTTLLKLYYMDEIYLNSDCFKTTPKLLAVSDNEVAKYLVKKFFELHGIDVEIYQLQLDNLYELIAKELVKLKDTKLVFLGFGGVNYNILHTLYKAAKKYKVKLPSITVIENDELDITNIFRLPIEAKRFRKHKADIAATYGFKSIKKFVADVEELKEFNNAIFVGNVDLNLRSKLFAQNKLGYIFVGHHNKEYTVYNNYYINRSEDIDISSFIVETYGRIRPASFMLSMQYVTLYTLKAIKHTIQKAPYKFSFNEDVLSKLHSDLFPYDPKTHTAFVPNVYRMVVELGYISNYVPCDVPMAEETIDKMDDIEKVKVNDRAHDVIRDLLIAHIDNITTDARDIKESEIDGIALEIGEKFAITKNLNLNSSWTVDSVLSHLKLRIRRNIKDLHSYLKNVLEDDNIYGVIAKTKDGKHINITHPLIVPLIDKFEFVEFVEYVFKTNVIQTSQDIRPYNVLKRYIKRGSLKIAKIRKIVTYKKSFTKTYLNTTTADIKIEAKLSGFTAIPTHIAIHKTYLLPEYAAIIFSPEFEEKILVGNTPNAKAKDNNYIRKATLLCWGSAKPNSTPTIFNRANFNSAFAHYTNAAYYKAMKMLALDLLNEA